MQPLSPRNISTEHWKELPNLAAFLESCLYLKNIDSAEHMQNVLLIVLFWFSSTILLSKIKLLFFILWTKIWQILHVILENINQFSFKFCINLQCY